MNRLSLGFGILVASLARGPTTPPSASPQEDRRVAVPQDLFSRVNGVTLHYLDWGGKGDLLLFLPGWSHTAHTFDGIAPAFAGRYHAMGLTRRGHGASEKPSSELDLETLVRDVVAFLDAVGAPRTILVGHSFAGLEMPLVAARLPDRVAGLVFLDAVYDWPALFSGNVGSKVGRYYEPPDTAFASRETLEDWFRRRDPTTWGPAQAANLRSQIYLGPEGRVAWQLPKALGDQVARLAGRAAAFSGIRVPTLVIWANQTEPGTRSMKSFGYAASDVEIWRKWASETDFGNKQRGIEALKRSVPNASVVEMSAPHTLHWYDPSRVIQLMNGFLDQLSTRGSRAR